MKSLPQTGNDLGEVIEHDNSKHKGEEEDVKLTTTKHIPRDSCEGQNIAMRIVHTVAPPKFCVHVEQAPQCSKWDVVPSTTVQDVGRTPSDATIMSSEEGKVAAHGPNGEQQHPGPVLEESCALLQIIKGEEGANPEDGVHCVDV